MQRWPQQRKPRGAWNPLRTNQMHAILWIFIAVAFGLMLFVSIQEELPAELAFLKAEASGVSTGPTSPSAGAVAKSNTRTFTYEGWSVRQTGATIEIVKPLLGRMELNGNVFDNPELGILCHAGKLDLRIDSRLATTGTQTTPVTFNGVSATWAKGASRNIFPPNPPQLVGMMLKQGQPFEVTLSFVDLGKQKLQLNPAGLAALHRQLPASCQ